MAVHVGLLRDGSSPSDQASKLWRRLKVLGSVTCYLTLKNPTTFIKNVSRNDMILAIFLREYLQQHRTIFSQVLETRSTGFQGRVFGPTEVYPRKIPRWDGAFPRWDANFHDRLISMIIGWVHPPTLVSQWINTYFLQF